MTVPIIDVDHLSKQFGKPDESDRLRPGCRDISLRIGAGETLGIVGESGSGKTTLGRCMAGLTGFDSGTVRHHGNDVATFGAKARHEFRRAVQIVFQNPETALNPRMTAGRFVAEALRNFRRVERSRIRARLVELAGLVDLNESLLARYAHQLSGGQKQRFGLMRALACEPDLIVLDEPTSALDVSVQAQVLRTLKDVQKRASVAYVLISHDVGVIHAMCDRVMVMYLGYVVEEGPTDAVLFNPAHPYTRALIDAVPRIHHQIIRPFTLREDLSLREVKATECPLRRRCPLAIDKCREMPPTTDLGSDHHVACWRSAEVAATGKETAAASVHIVNQRTDRERELR
jgi:oligopeptide/dipeptide ABC transporter ATP-binding protein